jgi:dipeptidyl aminopeptidase/acylaminoacyl peptidase
MLTRSTRISFGFMGGVILLAVALVPAQRAVAFDAAAAFGARESAMDLSLSPDGKSVAYVAPGAGQGTLVYTLSLEKGAKPKQVLFANGKPDRIRSCSWVADDRLVCLSWGVGKNPHYVGGLVQFSRFFAVNSDGTNVKLLSTEPNPYSRGVPFYGGDIIDLLPDENGSLLMVRAYVPDIHLGSRLGSGESGLGVDRIDTRTLDVSHVLHPDPEAATYITDGRGTVRIMGSREKQSQLYTAVIHYSYRPQNSQEWKSLGEFNVLTGEGFEPLAVDHDLNVAYGLKKKDGRYALYTVDLDQLREELVYSRPDVDVGGLIRLGRRQRVVGATYVTDTRQAEYLSPDVKRLQAALSRAISGAPIRIVDSSTDENTMLIFAGRDNDPGVYYIFDRKERRLDTFLVKRDELEGVKLATVKPISYPAEDGVMVPGYLTLPPGHDDAKGLPAIVLPHGGPSARDEWGFDWLSQFFANRGFAVLQPEFRGSTGYGDAWFQQNGFQSWRTAIGDVLAAGHWLVSQGVDPSKLGIVGWSYGGYAALQSAVVEPSTFKAVIAIAPVTDLSALKEQARRNLSYGVESDFIGDGPHIHEGSPIDNADKIKVPVLMFQGTLDFNVDISQSERMAERLKEVGARCELVTFDGLDHYLDDASARTQMLRKSDAFLRQALGM